MSAFEVRNNSQVFYAQTLSIVYGQVSFEDFNGFAYFVNTCHFFLASSVLFTVCFWSLLPRWRQTLKEMYSNESLPCTVEICF